MMRLWRYGVGGLLLAGVLAAGCGARAQAETVPDGPPLTVPAPPERVFTPFEPAPVAEGTVAPEPVTGPAPDAVAAQPPPRATTPPRSSEPPPAPPPAPAQRELRAATTQADAELEKKVQGLLATARRDLGAVSYPRLTAQGREQFNQARSFADQATDALAQRNFVFAETLADKAAQLAAGLRGR